jgi:uncharacterized membrane protein YccC
MHMPHLDATKLAYGVKLALALLIAVGIELWFNLGLADSAAVCVLVVKSNILGTTIQKSILRMIGNLIGCSIGLAFIALFAQDRIAGAVGYSLYSVFCCFFLQRSRYAPAWHWTYDSAAIVFLFHLGSATESFTFTVERWLELSIGIASMTLVSSILWPSRAGTVFEDKFMALLRDAAADVTALGNVLTSRDSLQTLAAPSRLAAGIATLRSQLDTASRDTARYERFHDGYQALVDRLQSLIARTTLLADSISGMTDKGSQSDPRSGIDLVADAIDRLKLAMDALVDCARRHFDEPQSPANRPDSHSTRVAAERIQTEVTTTVCSLREAASILYACEAITSVADGIDQLSEEIARAEQRTETQAKLSAIQSLDSNHEPFWKRLDVRKSLVSGLVIALAFAVWMATNWPAGPMGVFVAVLVTSKNCTAPYLPPKALLPGAIAGVFVGAVIYLGVLPALDGFLQLAMLLFPFCTVAGYLMLSSNAKVAGVAGLSTIIAVKLSDLQSHQSVSFSHVVGFSYAFLGGIVIAFIVLAVTWPIVPEKMFTNQVKAICRSCRQWLSAVSSAPAASPTARAAFVRQSAKQLGLYGLWGNLLNYGRLPAGSRQTVTELTSVLQATILHLIELEQFRHQRQDPSHTTSLAQIAQRLDQQLCEVLDGFIDALEQGTSAPELPDAKGLLKDLHKAFEELGEGVEDDAERRARACHVLSMIGQYSALVSAVTASGACLRQLDWNTLNQSYF